MLAGAVADDFAEEQGKAPADAGNAGECGWGRGLAGASGDLRVGGCGVGGAERRQSGSARMREAGGVSVSC